MFIFEAVQTQIGHLSTKMRPTLDFSIIEQNELSCFNLFMENKGFADNQISIETPNDVSLAEKPLKTNQIKSGRVDINVLKSKLQETESKEFKKNLFVLSSLVLGLGILGIYLSF
tara:strand:+ start:184 stop:528 length:345 start_codon:yes stop_codon:yes gene_type:complete